VAAPEQPDPVPPSNGTTCARLCSGVFPMTASARRRPLTACLARSSRLCPRGGRTSTRRFMTCLLLTGRSCGGGEDQARCSRECVNHDDVQPSTGVGTAATAPARCRGRACVNAAVCRGNRRSARDPRCSTGMAGAPAVRAGHPGPDRREAPHPHPATRELADAVGLRARTCKASWTSSTTYSPRRTRTRKNRAGRPPYPSQLRRAALPWSAR
jgi:hypothetical protein